MPLFPQGGGLYPNNIDNVLLADMAQATVKGRAAGAGTGDPQDLTAAQLGLLLGGPNFRNILGRNGGFEVWQRGAGGSAGIQANAGAGVYTADGWFLNAGAGHNCFASQQGPLISGSQYSAYITRISGQGGAGNNVLLEFPLDTDEIFKARGSIVTLSFKAMAGATFSAAGSLLACQFSTGTGAPAKLSAVGFTGQVDVIPATNVVLTATATPFALTSTVVVPANATQASVLFFFAPVGTAGANDGFFIDDVQLEVGSVATPFERRPFESELLACMRHYEKTFPYQIAPATGAGFANAIISQQSQSSSAGVVAYWRYAVPKRVPPSVTPFNPTSANALMRNYNNTADYAFNFMSGADTKGVGMVTSVVMTAGDVGLIHLAADAGI